MPSESRAMTRRGGKSWIALASTVAVAAASAIYLAYKQSKRAKIKPKTSQGKIKQGNSSSAESKLSKAETKDPSEEEIAKSQKLPEPKKPQPVKSEEKPLDYRFRIAAKQATAIPNVSQKDQLKLYGLYKQATVGDATEHPPSGFSLLNPVAAVKFSCWEANAGLSHDEAMSRYIDLVDTILVGGEKSDNDDDNDDLLNAVWGESSGMGVKPSTLAHDDAQADYDQTEAEPEGDENDGAEDSPSVVTNGHGRFALHMAARDDRPDELRELLSGPAVDPNALDESGQTALHLAADRGHPECIRALLDADADVNAADSDGISVLQAAVISGHVEACRLLLEGGANPDHADRDGDTPRSCAEDDEELSKLLAKYPTVGATPTETAPVTPPETAAAVDATVDVLENIEKITIDLSSEDEGDI